MDYSRLVLTTPTSSEFIESVSNQSLPELFNIAGAALSIVLVVSLVFALTK